MIVLVPARSGSKGVPNKNIYNLKGYPVMAWSITIGKQLDLQTWVMTDSPTYAMIADSFGAKVISEAPGEPGTGDFRYLKYMFENTKDDEILLLRPTTPLREVDIVKKAISEFNSFGYHTSLRSANEMSESAYKSVFLINGYFKPLLGNSEIPELFNLPRQQLATTYHPNGYVDIIMRSTIDLGKIWGGVYGDMIQPFLTDDVGELDAGFDIDHIEWLSGRGVGGTTFEYLRSHFNPQEV